MKYILIIFISVVISACSIDDFCNASNTTPKLNIGFYNKDDKLKQKKIDSTLFIWADGKTVLKEFQKQGVTKISIPLNTQATATIYNIGYKNKKDTIVSKLLVSYKTNEEYVSRSCGYRITFKELKIQNNTAKPNWIDSFTPNELGTINNQDSTHVKIFH